MNMPMDAWTALVTLANLYAEGTEQALWVWAAARARHGGHRYPSCAEGDLDAIAFLLRDAYLQRPEMRGRLVAADAWIVDERQRRATRKRGRRLRSAQLDLF